MHTLNNANNIGVIGIGNIGFSICEGLSKKNNSYKLFAYDRNSEKIKKVSQYDKEINILQSDWEVISLSDIIILCVRTNQVIDWIVKNKERLNQKTLILVQSGIYLKDIKKCNLSQTVKIFRLITNVNTSENIGHTLIIQEPSEVFKEIVNIFKFLGEVVVVETENTLDKLSLITGCTPAITAMFLEGLNKCYKETNDNILLSGVIINTLKTIQTQSLNPNEYAKKTYSKGGVFEKCVNNIEKDSQFQKIIESWLNPLKISLK